MKRISILMIMVLLTAGAFANCYFSLDGPSGFIVKDKPAEDKRSPWFMSGTVGLTHPFAIKDNFEEYKTSYYLEPFVEAQFMGRWLHGENSSQNKVNEIDVSNDFYVSAGINILQIFHPKISYGVLSKDFFASVFVGVPLPLLGAKFLAHDGLGFQACFGLEPMYNISEKDSLYNPTYLNFKAHFTIYLDFSRYSRYKEYAEQQIEIQQQEKERMQIIQEEKREREKLRNQRQNEKISNNENLNKLSRDEWEWALRAVMVYKTFYEYGYSPTYDEYTLKFMDKERLKLLYGSECASNLETRKVIDKADSIVMLIQICLVKTGGYCDAVEMARIVKLVIEHNK